MPGGSRTSLYLAIFIAQWLCGLATVTSVSRMIFAFSRDDGLPVGSKALAKVSPTYRTPVAAIWTGSILRCCSSCWLVASLDRRYPGLYDRRHSTVIFLFLSFTIPIVLGMLAWGTSKWDKTGPWNLGEGRSSCSLCCRSSPWC